MTTNEKAVYIASSLMYGAGFTYAGTAGVLANIEHESAFIEINVENRCPMSDEVYTAMVDVGGYDFETDNGKHYGYGLCQWTEKSRKRKLYEFAKQHGCSIGDLDMQIAFLIAEMQEFPYVWNKCRTSDSPYDCGYAVCKYYEIPDNTESRSVTRGHRAEEWYKFLIANIDTGYEHFIDGYKDEQSASTPVTSVKKSVMWPPRDIDKNMSGDDVAVLQAVLIARGYDVEFIDGDFDGTLDSALRQFQKDKSLKVDGVCGPNTWKKVLEIGVKS